MIPFVKPTAMLVVAAGAGLAAAPAGAADIAVTPPEALDPVVRVTERAHDRAARTHVRLHRANAALEGRAREGDRRAEVEDWSARHLRRRNVKLRRENRELRRQGAATSTATATPAHLQAIAACESGGDPSAVGGGGQFRGKYQFDLGTWASVGGTGDPAAAPEAEQDRRAAMLYAQRGSAPWPVCG